MCQWHINRLFFYIGESWLIYGFPLMIFLERNKKKKTDKKNIKKSSTKTEKRTAKAKRTECIQTAQEKTDAVSPVSRPLYRNLKTDKATFYRA